MSERTSEWPSTYVSILVCFRPQCSSPTPQQQQQQEQQQLLLTRPPQLRPQTPVIRGNCDNELMESQGTSSSTPGLEHDDDDDDVKIQTLTMGK